MQNLSINPAPPPQIHLQAIDKTRNIARGYRIDTSRDLFGHWIIDLHWGRIGTRGQSRTFSFAEIQAAQTFVRQTLSRRASARKRIGVAYEPTIGAVKRSDPSP